MDTSWINPPEWMGRGICASADPDFWFPPKGSTGVPAKLLCEGCPVMTECLQYALDNREPWGVWGGTSERDRRRMLKDAA